MVQRQFHELKDHQRQCGAYRSTFNAVCVRTRPNQWEERFTWARLVRMRTESCLAATDVKNNRSRKGMKLRDESVSTSAPIWEGALAKNQAVSSSDIWTLHSNIPSCKRKLRRLERRNERIIEDLSLAIDFGHDLIADDGVDSLLGGVHR